MHRCPHCGRGLRLSDEVCSECRGEVDRYELAVEADESRGDSPVSGESLVAVARLHNGAEAGYFADEVLRLLDVELELLARERFDGVHAVWAVDYILMAPRGDAERVASLLQELVDRTDDREDTGHDSPSEGRSDSAGAVWAPLLLTLAAGSIACWGLERANHRPGPAGLVDRDPRAKPDLLQLISDVPGVWTQKSADGRGYRTLLLDPKQQTAILREDRNGDGDFEREWEFDWKER
jgi:hypothetical protein